MFKNKIFRQGDVIFKETGILPSGITKKAGLIVAEGEATGHMHQFETDSDVQLWTVDSKLYAQVNAPSPFIHPEHEKIIIEPGVYEIGNEREWDYADEEMKKVID